MAQQALVEIALASERIDQLPILIFGHGIDGEVAAGQVLFQRDVGRGMEDETVIAPARLALGARQGVLFLALRMQKYREILAYRQKSGGLHCLGGAAHHHPVAIASGSSKQAVAYCAAHQVALHQRRLSEPDGRGRA